MCEKNLCSMKKQKKKRGAYHQYFNLEYVCHSRHHDMMLRGEMRAKKSAHLQNQEFLSGHDYYAEN